jgi:oligosaccharide repeat unit polymerase
MFAILCTLTGLTLVLGALLAFALWKDALHPSVVTALPFLFTLSFSPLILNANGGLESFFDADQLVRIQRVYFLSVICFSVGLLSVSPTIQGSRVRRRSAAMPFQVGQRRLYQVSVILGLVAVAAYLYMIHNVGGFLEAYSRVKGGGRAGSGYIGEAILFSFPAVLAIAVCRRAEGRTVRPTDAILALVFMSPHLIQGTFGGRRGPLFLALATLFLAWTIARGRRVSVGRITLGIGAAGLSMLFVWSQRQQVYVGSEGEIEVARLWDVVAPEEVTPGNTYVTSGAHMLSADYNQNFYWGYRYFVTFFVRPIPRQLWPTKYEDMGATWVYRLEDEAEAIQLVNAIGFSTPGGAAMPSIADAYVEFSWGVLPFFLVLGWVFAKTWSLHRAKGGEWTIVYAVMLALSVYLASQSVSAWAHRLLFIAVPTHLIWKYWINVAPRALSSPRRRKATLDQRSDPTANPPILVRRKRMRPQRHGASKIHRAIAKTSSPEAAR